MIGVNLKTILTIVGKKLEYNCGVFIEKEPFEMYSPGSSPSLKLPLGPIQTPVGLYPLLLSVDISGPRRIPSKVWLFMGSRTE